MKAFLDHQSSVAQLVEFDLERVKIVVGREEIDGWVQHYPKCLYKVYGLRIVLHLPIKMLVSNCIFNGGKSLSHLTGGWTRAAKLISG